MSDDEQHDIGLAGTRLILATLTLVCVTLVLALLLRVNWNASVPRVFGLPEITTVESLSLLVVAWAIGVAGTATVSAAIRQGHGDK